MEVIGIIFTFAVIFQIIDILILMKVRVFTAFSGYDSQCLALDRLKEHFPNFDYELVGWAEIDKYAIQAHNALFPQWSERNYGDISKIDWSAVPDFDLFTYSSPCQDFSNAGLQRGAEEGSGTRSSLLWECRRAIVAKRPKYLLFENVAGIVSKKFMPLFQKWIAELDGYGYENFWQIMNAKEFGIPQNRKRVFMVSILNIEPYPAYEFPKPFPLELRLKNMLEENVDEKYYLSDKAIEGFTWNPKIINPLKGQSDNGWHFEQQVYDAESIARALKAGEGSGNMPKVIQVGYVNGGKHQQDFVQHEEGICRCICTGHHASTPHLLKTMVAEPPINCCGGGDRESKAVETRYRIRKLTPRECYRLMGVDDADIDKIQASGISNSQQYKMAGNSIAVDNLYHIFRTMFVDNPTKQVRQLTLF